MIQLASVTKRIKQVKQPRGGYLNPKDMEVIQRPIRSLMEYQENIPPYTVGTAVDYLTRYMMTGKKSQAFKISIIGANQMGDGDQASKWLNEIEGLDDNSICRACQLVNYDSMYRAGFPPSEFKKPDASTILSVRMLVERSMDFFKDVGDIIADGFTFGDAYTHLIHAGDGDFLTEDTLWDFKVSKYPPTKDHTLQLIIYYLMGKASKMDVFKSIRYIAIYNPRLNTIYKYDMSQMDINTIYKIRKDVIGYDA